jgi:hypothetical protein
VKNKQRKKNHAKTHLRYEIGVLGIFQEKAEAAQRKAHPHSPHPFLFRLRRSSTHALFVFFFFSSLRKRIDH